MSGVSSIILQDIFGNIAIDAAGKKFDKVSRIDASSENFEMDLTLDINTDIYPINKDDRLNVALATSLSLDGSPDEGRYDPTLNYGKGGKESLMDRYEYVMYGKVFKYIVDKNTGKVSVYMSFGGLMMKLTADPQNLTGIDMGMKLYLLMRKAD
eukprot:GEZU01040178.1.p1 GENE.GEZU01040178.1~~GEZU01040178.1.p1  ORF type:complete len:154 (+),score=49.19 GEZU01040178.1:46-507(+)